MTALFVYGTLMPGRLRWPLAAPFVVEARSATVVGTLLDTGLGYPGLRLGGQALVHGVHLHLHEPATLAWQRLDEAEGPTFERVAMVTSAGPAETYAWRHRADGERVLVDGRWPLGAEQ